MVFEPSAREAALALAQQCQGEWWYSSVGITEIAGRVGLVLYTRSAIPASASKKLPKELKGFPIFVEYMVESRQQNFKPRALL